MRRYLARYADGRTRSLWAMSREQAEKQARLYGTPESVLAGTG